MTEQINWLNLIKSLILAVKMEKCYRLWVEYCFDERRLSEYKKPQSDVRVFIHSSYIALWEETSKTSTLYLHAGKRLLLLIYINAKVLESKPSRCSLSSCVCWFTLTDWITWIPDYRGLPLYSLSVLAVNCSRRLCCRDTKSRCFQTLLPGLPDVGDND